MSSIRSLAAWTQRVALTDYGYRFALPALVAAEAVLSELIIRKIEFTEIDFQTYIGQAELFLHGERDYTRLDPAGGSGPCVYPAAHLYLYSLLHRLTQGGNNLVVAQHAFQILLIANNLVVAALYRLAGLPPLLVLPLILSKRIHSIFLLRLFNDPVALLLVYVSLWMAVRGRRWVTSAFVLSLALGIKMNVLLFLPGLVVACFVQTGFSGTAAYLFAILAVQAALSLPFTLNHDPKVYFANAFDFSRVFLYEWTVNWRFVDEATFLSRRFALALLGLHLSLLLVFVLFKWTSIGTEGPRWVFRHWNSTLHLRANANQTGREAAAILALAFTSNLVGVVCSRSLHYQFYSWYFHQVPFLVYLSRLPLVLKLAIPVALEWCWNVFPSTQQSSLVLLACHIVLVAGCFTLPALPSPSSQEASDPATVREDEKEIEHLLVGDQAAGQSTVAHGIEPASDTDAASAARATTATAAAAAVAAAARAKKAEHAAKLHQQQLAALEREQKEARSFQRRIATRRKVVAVLGRGVLVLRPMLVVGAVVLALVIPHPYSPVSKGTYVDENALQPGQARVYWDYFDVTYADMLSEKVEVLGQHAGAEERAEFVGSEFAKFGLEAHLQRFVGAWGGNRGVNVYARSGTPRIDGREAVILSASWKSQWFGDNDPWATLRNQTTDNHAEPFSDSPPPTRKEQTPDRRTNVRGIASLLTLARYLSTQAHLSKDLIFVVTDGHVEGMSAWSSAYFGGDARGTDAILDGGSAVWNAISIDYPADSFSSLVVQYEGLDGQLPNMDVVNTLVRIAERTAGGLPTSLHAGGHANGNGGGGQDSASHDSRLLLWARRYLAPLLQLAASLVGASLSTSAIDRSLIQYDDGLKSAFRQFSSGIGLVGTEHGMGSTGGIGPHSFLQRYHVDAISIYAVPALGPYGFFHIGKVVESFVRSMSNLLERLHHSQFFYLLLTTHRFVPIGVVVLVPLFLSLSLTIRGLAIWFEEERESKSKREELFAEFKARFGGCLTEQQRDQLDNDVPPETPTRSWYRQQAAKICIVSVSLPPHLGASTNQDTREQQAQKHVVADYDSQEQHQQQHQQQEFRRASAIDMYDFSQQLDQASRPYAGALWCVGWSYALGAVLLGGLSRLLSHVHGHGHAHSHDSYGVSVPSSGMQSEIPVSFFTPASSSSFFPVDYKWRLLTRAAIAGFGVSGLIIPRIILRLSTTDTRSQSQSQSQSQWQRQRLARQLAAFASLQAGTLTAILSVVNFSLATLLGVVFTLMLVFDSPFNVGGGRGGGGVSRSSLSTLTRAASSPTSTSGSRSKPTTSARALALVRIAISTLGLAALNPVLWCLVVSFPPTSTSNTVSISTDVGTALLTNWGQFSTSTVPIVVLVYVPILLQVQMAVFLAA
ncbi:ALG3-domain-containing protein [Testicularia cyperi]|uniref:Dol-P-Man:Man(5)GlcNAc(2)-PP-Dol alpha-1,3-mannosyltransferase n=1 Tax=Testicularia cyperi TaxID=1882483 RepID=A0A317XMV8_9BASI|nr:ALG3-domain-containing protein [Testicularia cyperi]